MRPAPRTVTPHPSPRLGIRGAGIVLLAALLALAIAPVGAADDKELFRESTASPYVFFLLDVSGSMNQSVPCSVDQALNGDCGYPSCSQQQIDDDLCPALCPKGACLPRMIGDDPFSRMRTAKEAIYEIARQVDDIQFGFGMFGRRNMQVLDKHWWYRPLAAQPASTGLTMGPIVLESGRAFPSPSYDDIPGHEDIFGQTAWSCDTFTRDGGRQHQCESDGYDCAQDRFVGCEAGRPADLANRWEYEKIRRIPKLDDDISDDVTFYIRDTDGAVYQVTYHNVSSLDPGDASEIGVDATPELGDPYVPVRIEVDCESGCDDFVDQLAYVVFEKADEMVYWEPGEGVRRDAPGIAYYGPGSRRASAGNSGLEGNGDDDTYNGVNLLVETIADPDGRGGAYSVGDLIPFDWKRNQTRLLRARMAPNHLLPLQTDRPDFQIAPYLVDHRSNRLEVKDPEQYLRDRGQTAAADLYADLDSEAQELIRRLFKPIVPRGGTPTGAAVAGFQSWLEGWLDVASGNGGDPNLDCRKIYLVILTDGLASDGLNACDRAQDLRSITRNGQNFEVRTFGVAFGRFAEDFVEERLVTGRDNMLECIAEAGGTSTDDDLNGDAPGGTGPGVLFPQNKQELVDRLLEVIQLLRPQPRTLTGVAVPSVQADAADKVFLSDFTPLNSRPVWPGKVHAFVKPLPVEEITGRPDFDEECDDLPADEPLSSCYLYNIGDKLVQQIQGRTNDVVGNADTQRRVYYSLFQDIGSDVTPTVPRERQFLLTVDDSTPVRIENDLVSAFDVRAADDPSRTLREMLNDVTVQIPAIRQATLPDGGTVTYALGDIFHADPLLVGSPPNSLYFLQDAGPAADDPSRSDSCADGNRGYRCFFQKHRTRRRVLFVASNDGMLHAFDVGGWSQDDLGFDNGSGREMFAYLPRPVMSTLRRMYESGRHDFTVDGQIAAADVFVDPVHSEVLGDPPSADDRQWRSILVGSLRRGAGTPQDFELPALPTILPTEPEERDAFLELLDGQEVSGYFSLDITQPDPLDTDDPEDIYAEVPAGRNPPCAALADGSSLPDGCEGPAYGTPLWEFSDSFNGILLDEDGDSLADLAHSWSTANLGRIRVCVADCDAEDPELEDRYVAVFGGGLDPERPGRGDWLYMVDTETGQAIYKWNLDGAVPAQPAAVDIDLDGYLDRIYLGTTEGYLYRSDLKIPTVDGVDYPPLETVATPLQITGRRDLDGTPGPDVFEWSPKRITDSRFAPVKLFDVNADDGDTRQVFYRPTVFYVPAVNNFAVTFGTGNREDLFDRNQPTGRLFTMVDPVTDLSALTTPYGPSDLVLVTRDSDAAAQGDVDLLITPPSGNIGGWWMEMGLNERLITDPFTLSGILVYSTYQPTGITTGDASLCSRQGQSRVYVVSSRNANGFLFEGNERARYQVVTDFVTAPFPEQSATKNRPRSDAGSRNTADQLNARLRLIMEELKRNFPESCKFSDSYRQDIKLRSSDTGMLFVAPVPVCIIEKNYLEGGI